MHGMLDLRVIKQRHEEMLREAESNRLKKALRANRRRPAASRFITIVAWELLWAGGLLRKLLRMPKNRV